MCIFYRTFTKDYKWKPHLKNYYLNTVKFENMISKNAIIPLEITVQYIGIPQKIAGHQNWIVPGPLGAKTIKQVIALWRSSRSSNSCNSVSWDARGSTYGHRSQGY